jgi:hypothetical protein
MKDLIVFVIKVMVVFAAVYVLYFLASPYQNCLQGSHYVYDNLTGKTDLMVPNSLYGSEYCQSRTEW